MLSVGGQLALNDWRQGKQWVFSPRPSIHLGKHWSQGGKKCEEIILLYTGSLKNLPRFQGAEPEHVRVERSCYCFPEELWVLTHSTWHIFLQSENVFWVVSYNKTIWSGILYKKIFLPSGQSGWTKLSSQPVNLQHAQPLIKPPVILIRVETLLLWTLRGSAEIFEVAVLKMANNK